MTKNNDITDIEYWLKDQQKRKKTLTLGERLEEVENQLERGDIDQDQYD